MRQYPAYYSSQIFLSVSAFERFPRRKRSHDGKAPLHQEADPPEEPENALYFLGCFRPLFCPFPGNGDGKKF